MKIVASIQARMGSTRLPGKVLKDIGGKPMLLRHIERLQQSKMVDEVIVATTTSSKDDKIVEMCQEFGVTCFRGSENDVLARITNMIKAHQVDVHVECFGDSPFTDPQILDEIVTYYLDNQKKYDFVSNSLKTTYPPGLEVLVYSGDTLVKADSLVSKEDPLREHVSIHITKKKDIFNVKNLEAPENLHFPEIFLEVDTPEDFTVISNIFNYFDSINKVNFSALDILEYLKENKNLIEINNKVERRWKEFRDDD
jgi:spore coat polysaccharide biosynthesis protein SpsF